jgi:hypothetical protein
MITDSARNITKTDDARVITKNPAAKKSKKLCVTGRAATPVSALRPAVPGGDSVAPHAVRLSGAGNSAKNTGERGATAAFGGTSIFAAGPRAAPNVTARYGNAAHPFYLWTAS